MGTTYQDNLGNSFGTREAAKASNLGTSDNAITNAKVAAGLLPQSQMENVPQQSVGQTVARAQAMLAQTKAQGSTAFKGSSFERAIPVTQLTTNIQPVQATQPTQATTAQGMLAEFQTGADTFQDNLKAQREAAMQPLQQSRADYTDFLSDLRGETDLTSEAYSQKDGVDDVQEELNNINQQIRAEQHSLTRKLESLEKNEQGLFGGALTDLLEDTERESLRKQADLTIIQQGVQGRYDSAKAIADRAVSAYLEKQKLTNDALRFNYEENKELFNKAEQREFEVMMATRERALEREDENLRTISDLAIEAQRNGAPSTLAAQIRGATTVEEAMRLSGGYIGLAERQKANAAMANADLERRLILLKLAEAGDIQAMQELGLDPTAPDVAAKIKAQDEITRIDKEIAKVDGLLSNTSGLAASAGTIRSPFVAALGQVAGTTAAGAGIGSVIPVLGTIGGAATGFGTGLVTAGFEYAQTRDQKAKFLADAKYVLDNLTVQKIKELKESGVSFNPMTDKDAERIGNATAVLNGYSIIKDGNLVGFTSESGAQSAIQEIKTYLTEVREREARKLVSDNERLEIEAQ